MDANEVRANKVVLQWLESFEEKPILLSHEKDVLVESIRQALDEKDAVKPGQSGE